MLAPVSNTDLGSFTKAQASNAPELASKAPSKGVCDSATRSQDKDTNGLLGVPSPPSMQTKPLVSVKSTTSASSKEHSDDEEVEGETETTKNMDPLDAKRVRRMISNRESARRSRRRKQAHLTELETQVAQLRGENSTLLKRLTDISQKYNEAAVDNRVLRADVETLRAKVKMAEETVKRVTNLNPIFHGISGIGMPPFEGSPSVASSDAAVPVQDDMGQHFFQPTTDNHIPIHNLGVNNDEAEISTVANVQQPPAVPAAASAEASGEKRGQTASLQRVASLEHLQKRIRGGVSSSASQANW